LDLADMAMQVAGKAVCFNIKDDNYAIKLCH
jgi:hypothetical protein